MIRCATGVLLLCALSACKKDPEAVPGQPAAGTAATQAVPPQQAVSAKVQAMSADQLREAAGKALTEQRLYAPAGDNAMEYYLALRDKQPNDPAVSSALTDLQPYALIATEQSIGRDDFIEAQRLYALMDKADPKAPALPRLKDSIATAQKAVAQRAVDAETQTAEETTRQAELEKERLAQQQAAQQLAAQQLATQQAAQRAATPATAPPAQQPQPAAPRPVATQPAAPPPTQQPAAQPAAPAASSSNELRPISQPSPRYPAAAARAGQSGTVQVEFTVGADGSVTSARVVEAKPPRVFDREALAAVKKWRFQPIGSPVTSRRTIDFNPGN
ncbi:MAG: energy transducer TonB [Lysobacter sp.]|nr:energy transducer TonB [Lysobacter sp.]